MADKEWQGALEQIDEYRWRIPRSYRDDMRTDCIVYGSETLVQQMRKDNALEQLVNVATLPGIVGNALVMPDAHWGYGFPIGGVAAFDAEEGVISPGGVGYDINCLFDNSRILHRHGYTVPIGQMAQGWQSAEIACQDFTAGREARTGIARYLKLCPRHPVYRLKTVAGDEVIATADHPFWTPNGMVELRHLREGDAVAMFPFEGVPYEEPSDEVIVDEKDVRRLLLSREKDSRGHGLEQIIIQLKKRGLLPLRYNSPQLPYLLKLLGFVFGDGCLYFQNGRGKGTTQFYGKPEDLEDIRADVMATGFTPSPIYSRDKKCRIETAYREYQFDHHETKVHVVGSGFAALLAAMGAPIGNKAKQNYDVPAWLFRAPLWQKRLFLAALFGAELSAPRVTPHSPYCFFCPVLSMSKREGFTESGHRFLESVSWLLDEFGVETKKVSQRREQRCKDGSISYRLRLAISSKPEHLINLWSRVGFEYNRERRVQANAATQYLKLKSRVWEKRREAAQQARELVATGLPVADVQRELVGAYVRAGFVSHRLWRDAEAEVRVGEDFDTFEDYLATCAVGETGMVWERVASIELFPRDDVDYVYDFTVAHPDHNFIANGFVVSNCGVRLLRTDLTKGDVLPKIEALVNQLFYAVPSGTGSEGVLKLSDTELEEVAHDGAGWALKKGMGMETDAARMEANGRLPSDPTYISKRARDRGRPQVGTLGSGNHFLEVQVVDYVYDEKIARAFGIEQVGQITVMVHCGSRGFGHQVCTDFLEVMQRAVQKYGITLPDRQLACCPVASDEAEQYLKSMNCAANYAWANRQVIIHNVRRAFEKVLGKDDEELGMRMVYDVAHNIAKFEEYEIGGVKRKVIVHRKGATRAFGPGNPEVNEVYRGVGQPVIVPGDMGTYSFLLAGTKTAELESFGSTCHGAGRQLSRHAALKRAKGSDLIKSLKEQGIVLKAREHRTVAEEAPYAYKDVSEVVDSCHGAGIAVKVARLRPIGVVKG